MIVAIVEVVVVVVVLGIVSPERRSGGGGGCLLPTALSLAEVGRGGRREFSKWIALGGGEGSGARKGGGSLHRVGGGSSGSGLRWGGCCGKSACTLGTGSLLNVLS